MDPSMDEQPSVAEVLFGTDSLGDRARSAREIAGRENDWLCANGFSHDRAEYSTDVIFALLARDGMDLSITLIGGGINGIARILDSGHELRLPDQQPATLAHVLRCLYLAAKGLSL